MSRLWQFDPQTGELWGTEHGRALFDLTPDTPLTRDTLLAAIHPEDRDAAMAALQAASRQGRPVAGDVRVPLPDHQARWIRIRARSHADHQDAPHRLSGVFADITDQKVAEIEATLQRQEVAHLMRVSVMGELSGSIAHEINQPLTAIMSNAQAALNLLAHDSPNLGEVREALRDIIHDDDRAGEVIHRLRNLMKKGEHKLERVDLNDLVTSTIALLNSELISRGIGVKAELSNHLPVTAGDSIQLQQVLLNLIMNAMDAMISTPITQRLVVIATRATRTGGVEVLDAGRASIRRRKTGCSALLHHQGPRPRSRLGDLCDDSAGAWRKSDARQRRRWRSRCRLPAARERNADGRSMTQEMFTVFIVDDDPSVLKAMSRLLGSKGYHACAYSSPKESSPSTMRPFPDACCWTSPCRGLTALPCRRRSPPAARTVR